MWVLAAPADALAPLAPLLQARRALQPVKVISVSFDRFLTDPAAHLPARTAGILVVVPRRHGPRRHLTGPWIRDRHGQQVPVGWLPHVPTDLTLYALAMARVLRRPHTLGALAVLGQWEDRFLRVALRTARWFQKHQPAPAVFHWTADRIGRPDMIAGLRHGPGAAIYYGHGRANGWAGYHGVRATDFPAPWAEPVGGLLALCCDNASRRGGGLSFIEQLVLRGVCGGALAACAKSRHDQNRLLGPALCEVLTNHPTLTLAELVARADLPAGFWERTPYRFIGDPLVPLAAASTAAANSRQIYAPAPDEILAPWNARQQGQREGLADGRAALPAAGVALSDIPMLLSAR